MSITKVRASSWGSLFDCAHKWEGVHMLGMHSPSSPRALLGTAVHAGTAAFDTARMIGEPVSAFEAAESLIETLRHPREDVNWRGSDITLVKAETIGLGLLTKYCHTISPRYTFKAVELTTTPLQIDCGGGQIIELTGSLDRMRAIADTDLDRLADVKTGRGAVSNGVAKTAPHRPQLGTYRLLYEHTTGRPTDDVSEVIGMNTSGSQEIATGETRGARELMVGTEEYPGLIQIGAQMFRSGLFPPNVQSWTCSARYCPRWKTCKYHE